jgi:hypothetical protein
VNDYFTDHQLRHFSQDSAVATVSDQRYQNLHFLGQPLLIPVRIKSEKISFKEKDFS